ncbi:MAG: trehalose-6-phosphate synthase, partial [Hyphomicrobiaceae bacterium]
MRRLIAVSNRVADPTSEAQSGGLAVAIGDALVQSSGTWFGWDGTTIEDDQQPELQVAEHGNVRLATMPIRNCDFRDYYLGFSNKVLWPAFHYRLDLIDAGAGYAEAYFRVNREMAERLAPHVERGDLVWVHDYHLIPLGRELRMLGVAERIGFFLHIPFPPPDIFLAVPEHQVLAECLFSYDVVGFQTSIDTANFIRYVLEQAGGQDLGGGQVRAFGRVLKVATFPIGIDVEKFHAHANNQRADELIRRLQRHG